MSRDAVTSHLPVVASLVAGIVLVVSMSWSCEVRRDDNPSLDLAPPAEVIAMRVELGPFDVAKPLDATEPPRTDRDIRRLERLRRAREEQAAERPRYPEGPCMFIPEPCRSNALAKECL